MRSLPGKQAPVTHLVFSDGLSVLSMFVEPVDPQMQRLQGLSAEGAIGVYAREVDGYTRDDPGRSAEHGTDRNRQLGEKKVSAPCWSKPPR